MTPPDQAAIAHAADGWDAPTVPCADDVAAEAAPKPRRARRSPEEIVAERRSKAAKRAAATRKKRAAEAARQYVEQLKASTDADTDDTPTTGGWERCTEADLAASVDGFEVRRHIEGGFLQLWRLPTGDAAEEFVSGAVWLRGMTRDADGLDWCNVVDFIDHDQVRRRWLMPLECLAGDRAELLRQLLRRGLKVSSAKAGRDALHRYVGAAPNARYTSVASTGWHGASFVLPTRTVGPGDYLLTDPPAAAPSAGTVAQWRRRVAEPCRGNSRLVLALSAAFTSPLLRIADVESGGIHFVGPSSIGKSTAAAVSRSTWGAGLQSWRATDNGLEGVAARHSDMGLVLDEIGQVDPKLVGEVSYMLANGAGRIRARRDGTDRKPQTWRLLFVSTGETTLARHMAAAGRQAKAGQEVRLVSIEADAGAGAGLFEETHGATPQAFAEALGTAAAKYHGTAGPAFVEAIVGDEERVRGVIADVRDRFEGELGLGDADGQVKRVARRFALIAAAGELATTAGLTGWEPHQAIGAALLCFRSWSASWAPEGSREAEQAVTQVRAFIEGQSARLDAFDAPRDDEGTRTRDRVGFVRRDGGRTEYLLFTKSFDDEVCRGLDPKAVRQTLAARELLRGSGGKLTVTLKPASLPRKTRFVAITEAIHDAGDADGESGS